MFFCFSNFSECYKCTRIRFHCANCDKPGGTQFFIQKVFHNLKSLRFLHIYLEAFSASRTFGEEEQPVVVVVPHLKVLQRAPVDVLPYHVLSVVSRCSLSRRSHLRVLKQEACLVLSQCQDTEQDPTLTRYLHVRWSTLRAHTKGLPPAVTLHHKMGHFCCEHDDATTLNLRVRAKSALRGQTSLFAEIETFVHEEFHWRLWAWQRSVERFHLLQQVGRWMVKGS